MLTCAALGTILQLPVNGLPASPPADGRKGVSCIVTTTGDASVAAGLTSLSRQKIAVGSRDCCSFGVDCVFLVSGRLTRTLAGWRARPEDPCCSPASVLLGRLLQAEAVGSLRLWRCGSDLAEWDSGTFLWPLLAAQPASRSARVDSGLSEGSPHIYMQAVIEPTFFVATLSPWRIFSAIWLPQSWAPASGTWLNVRSEAGAGLVQALPRNLGVCPAGTRHSIQHSTGQC